VDTYITRICWNENSWERPSGLAANLEAPDGFSATFGFGHEEWLFSESHEVEGWQYGFLQGANKSQKRLAGTEIRVLLFTIGPNKQRYLVGELERCWVLTEPEADAAYAALEERGVIRQMLGEISSVQGSVEPILNKSLREKWTLEINNVRFRREHAIRYSELVNAPEGSPVTRYNRYQLISADPKQVEEWNRLTRSRAQKPLISITESAFPEVIVPDSTTFFEGAVLQVTINRYERDQKARKACIQHHGTTCFACDIDFGKEYGAFAEGLIHVHHLKPLSEIGHGYQVDPIKDLRPVCPNCHAVIHWGGECRDIDEVRRLKFLRELARRSDEADADPDGGIPWEEVKAKVRAKSAGPGL